ncbi:MAG: protein translocase SEC61 complex subunit gamma [Candidatus Aenigmatarchaeota archaeon]|nr:protein translocase SEC61 complex subunit gamma [Nanoarchaeota archaeon]
MGIASTLRKYIRVLQVARKPNKDEFTMSAKISAIGIVLIGVIGFGIFLAFIFLGV